jgi:hypothetical protein
MILKDYAMAIWCPHCHAMLPEGLEACPHCGASLSAAKPQSEEQISRSSIAWYSAYTIGIALIVIIVGVGVITLCMLLFIGR